MDVSTYEYPDRYFVEADSVDRDYIAFFGNTDSWCPPHFVDLSEPYCSCRDFNYNVLPYIDEPNARLTCKHIDAALLYRRGLITCPQPLPLVIKL
jgi:hypothetical protein